MTTTSNNRPAFLSPNALAPAGIAAGVAAGLTAPVSPSARIGLALTGAGVFGLMGLGLGHAFRASDGSLEPTAWTATIMGATASSAMLIGFGSGKWGPPGAAIPAAIGAGVGAAMFGSLLAAPGLD